MTDLRPILYVQGWLLLAVAATMALPALADGAVGYPDWKVFAAAAAFTLFFAVAALVAFRQQSVRLNVRQGFVLTSVSWSVTSAFAALPFVFADLDLSYADAFFEAVSGLTTTGSTVIVGLDAAPRGILLWRGLLQALGGLGIIVMAILVLPFLRVGGMQLFHAKSSDRSEKVMPRLTSMIGSIALGYGVLNLLSAIAFAAAGMDLFDAAIHAMTSLATGGFSTKDASIGFYQSPAIEWVATISMLLGGLPLVIYVRLARREFAAVAGDRQVRTMLIFLVVTIAVITVWLMATKGYEFERAVRAVALSVVSVVTTTGFVTEDYGAWGEFALAAFLVLMFVGGCTGSTSGGIKIFRFQIAWLRFRVQLRRLTQPHTIVPMVYQGRTIPEDVPGSVTHFCLTYVACTLAITLGLALTGLDFIAALSGAATAIGNVGPGLGPLIGPAGNFASVPDAAKWILSFAMLLGRLEIFTLLVLFSPHTWRG